MNLTNKKIKFTVNESKSCILDALKILGDEYINNLKKALNEK
jgi:oligoendopeptidase F